MRLALLTKKLSSDGTRYYLAGQTYYDVKAKTVLTLNKIDDDKFELIELGERSISTDKQNLLSFQPESDVG